MFPGVFTGEQSKVFEITVPRVEDFETYIYRSYPFFGSLAFYVEKESLFVPKVGFSLVQLVDGFGNGKPS